MELTQDLLSEWLRESLDNTVFDGPEFVEIGIRGQAPYYRTNMYVTKIYEHNGTTDDVEMMQTTYDDLVDDFNNCDGSVMNRIWDIHCIWHNIGGEDAENLLEFISGQMVVEFKSAKSSLDKRGGV